VRDLLFGDVALDAAWRAGGSGIPERKREPASLGRCDDLPVTDGRNKLNIGGNRHGRILCPVDSQIKLHGNRIERNAIVLLMCREILLRIAQAI